MSFTGSPTAFNRSPSVQAKLKSVSLAFSFSRACCLRRGRWQCVTFVVAPSQLFDEMGGENGTLKVSEIKKAVTGERNALKYDWVR